MRRFRLLVVCGVLTGATRAHADLGGFQLNHYEPTAPGDWFLAVPHPWYSSTRWLAAGLTFDYGHNPLITFHSDPDGSHFVQDQAVVAHQLVGHVDLAGSLFDRVNLGLSLPVTLLERGERSDLFGASPVSGAAAGNPRLTVMVRLWKQADQDPLSIHLGASVWFPIGGDGSHAGDANFRVAPRLVLAGLGLDHLRWSVAAAWLYREQASIGQVPAGTAAVGGTSVGQEIQAQAAAQWTDHERTWAVGPEVSFANVLNPANPKATFGDSTSIELMATGHYLIRKMVMIGLGAGVGLQRDVGTPDVRALLRIAWAPLRASDRDHDGVADDDDACPDVPGEKSRDPHKNGCPPDRDGDGVADAEDLCPDVPRGDHPDAARLGCPLGDRDHDGVLDDTDQCVAVAAGPHPDPTRPGCPLPDRDGDGVTDDADQCPDVAAGATPDADRPGCPRAEKPSADRDGDGVFDDADQCPDLPEGAHPDPARAGCPLADRDGDRVPDVSDACPDQAGAPDPDPKKSGCPGLVLIKDGKIVIMAPVFFATNREVILARSFPVLAAVAAALQVETGIKRLAVEGHSDAKGNAAHNVDLSQRRAGSVMQWLIGHGVAGARLEAHGYGAARPIASNKSNKGRAANRRVEFVILDPPQRGRSAPAAQGTPGTPATRAPAGPTTTTPAAPLSAQQTEVPEELAAPAPAGRGRHHRAGAVSKAGRGKRGGRHPHR